ncbi:MAG TPA: M56 family metallopeptidase [Anaerolineae bacterium]|nr:M56 family metallopeptidase [Anaerolineae bacterium]
MDELEILILNHILPTVAGSAFSLFLVLLTLNIFFIKRPHIRYAFLFIPMVKPLYVLITGIQLPGIDTIANRFLLLIQIPNLANLIPSPHYGSAFKPSDATVLRPETTGLLSLVVTIAVIATVLLVFFRWLGLLAFRKKLITGKELDQGKHESLLVLVKDLSLRAGIKTPRIIIVDAPSPFVLGIKNPAIILPDGLIDELTEEELEVVLAHEIAHIKRKDNLWLWLATFCRDIMFFNPVAWFTLELLSNERERAADSFAVTLTAKPIALASSIIKVAEKINTGTISASPRVKPAWAVAKTHLAPRNSLERRVSHLLKFKPYKKLALKIVPIAFLFLVLSYAQFTVNIRISEDMIFSFFG